MPLAERLTKWAPSHLQGKCQLLPKGLLSGLLMKREPQLQNIHSLDGPGAEAAAGRAVLAATPLPLAPAALVQAVSAFL